MHLLQLASHRANTTLSAVLLTSLLVCSCAKLEPLSDTQKGAILETLNSSGRAYNATIAGMGPSSSNLPTSFAGKRLDPSDSSLLRMSSVLRDKFKTKDCRIRLVSPNSNSAGFAQEIKRTFVLFRVWGDKYCPIEMDFKIATLMEPAIGRWAISYDYSYQVTDPAYKDLNDVDAIELHGGISTNGLKTNRVRKDFDLKGSIHSRNSGTISLESFGKLEGPSVNALSGETVWKFDYSDFSAEFHNRYDNGNISFLINQESIDSGEFDRYFSQGGDPFIYGAYPDLVH